MGKNSDLSDFERGMVVGARRAGQSVSETAELLGFSRTTISRVYREWTGKEKISSERRLCGRKSLVDSTGKRKMAKLVQADRNATVTEITSRYNQCVQKSISERTTRRTLKHMGYSKQRHNTAGKHGETAEDQCLQPDSDDGQDVQTETESNETNESQGCSEPPLT